MSEASLAKIGGLSRRSKRLKEKRDRKQNNAIAENPGDHQAITKTVTKRKDRRELPRSKGKASTNIEGGSGISGATLSFSPFTTNLITQN
jgi:hypothetical protein